MDVALLFSLHKNGPRQGLTLQISKEKSYGLWERGCRLIGPDGVNCIQDILEITVCGVRVISIFNILEQLHP